MSLTPKQNKISLEMFKDMVSGKLPVSVCCMRHKLFLNIFSVDTPRHHKTYLYSCRLVFTLSHLSTFAFHTFFYLHTHTHTSIFHHLCISLRMRQCLYIAVPQPTTKQTYNCDIILEIKKMSLFNGGEELEMMSILYILTT